MVRDPIEKNELWRFVLGGGAAVAVDFLCYRGLLFWGVPIFEAKYVGFVVGAAVGFVIQKYWTFKSQGVLRREIPKYVALYMLSAFVNAESNNIILDIYPLTWLAFLGATGISTVMNYLGQKFFVFRHLR